MSETTLLPQKKRMLSQDIAKGLAMLLVIGLHTASTPKPYLYYIGTVFCYIMTFYYFISGYNYRPGRRTKLENIKTRAKIILIAFFLYSICIWIIYFVYFLITKEMPISELLLHYPKFLLSENGCYLLGIKYEYFWFTNSVGPSWFIVDLLFASIIFFLIVDYAIANLKRLISIVILLTAITGFLVALLPGLPWNVQTVPLIAALMLLGAFFGKHKVFEWQDSKISWRIVNSLVALGIVIFLQLQFPFTGLFMGGAMDTKIGGWDSLFCIAYCLFGSYYYMNLCCLVEKIKFVSTFLAWFGRNSLQILLSHMVIVQFVSKLCGLKFDYYNMYDEYNVKYFYIFLISVVVISVYVFIWGKIKTSLKAKFFTR